VEHLSTVFVFNLAGVRLRLEIFYWGLAWKNYSPVFSEPRKPDRTTHTTPRTPIRISASANSLVLKEPAVLISGARVGAGVAVGVSAGVIEAAGSAVGVSVGAGEVESGVSSVSGSVGVRPEGAS
jgi:hypothetical protein